MENRSSQRMMVSGAFIEISFGEKVLGWAVRGQEVSRWDGCTIGENPLLMDGIFLEGMDCQQGKSGSLEKLV